MAVRFLSETYRLTFWAKVAYQAGVNEKLLGDFIRKHNVRDKVFRKCGPVQLFKSNTALNSLLAGSRFKMWFRSLWTA
jgi:hypothetical protein